MWAPKIIKLLLITGCSEKVIKLQTGWSSCSFLFFIWFVVCNYLNIKNVPLKCFRKKYWLDEKYFCDLFSKRILEHHKNLRHFH